MGSPRTTAIAALVALFGTACGDTGDATQVLVHLSASDALASRAATLSVRVISPEGDVVHQQSASVGDEVVLPATVPVVPRDGDASRRFEIEAMLLDDTSTRISGVRAEETFEEGVLREVTLTFPEVPTFGSALPTVDAMDERFETDSLVEVEVLSRTVSTVRFEDHLVFASMALRGAGGADGGQVRLLVDGEERQLAQPVGGFGQSAVMFTVLEGDGLEHTVSLALQASPERAASTDALRLVVVPVPPFADLQWESRLETAVVGSTFTRELELLADPIAAGQYLFIGSVAASETPGGASVNVIFETPVGAVPRTMLGFGREPFLPFFVARVLTLEPGATTFSISARTPSGASPGASVANPTIALLRLDAFAAHASGGQTEAQTNDGGGATEVLTLDVPDPGVGTHWLTISDAVVRTVGSDRGQIEATFLWDGSAAASHTQSTISGGTRVTVGHVDVFEQAGPSFLGSTIRLLNPSATVTEAVACEGTHLAIRFGAD